MQLHQPFIKNFCPIFVLTNTVFSPTRSFPQTDGSPRCCGLPFFPPLQFSPFLCSCSLGHNFPPFPLAVLDHKLFFCFRQKKYVVHKNSFLGPYIFFSSPFFTGFPSHRDRCLVHQKIDSYFVHAYLAVNSPPQVLCAINGFCLPVFGRYRSPQQWSASKVASDRLPDFSFSFSQSRDLSLPWFCRPPPYFRPLPYRPRFFVSSKTSHRTCFP